MMKRVATFFMWLGVAILAFIYILPYKYDVTLPSTFPSIAIDCSEVQRNTFSFLSLLIISCGIIFTAVTIGCVCFGCCGCCLCSIPLCCFYISFSMYIFIGLTVGVIAIMLPIFLVVVGAKSIIFSLEFLSGSSVVIGLFLLLLIKRYSLKTIYEAFEELIVEKTKPVLITSVVLITIIFTSLILIQQMDKGLYNPKTSLYNIEEHIVNTRDIKLKLYLLTRKNEKERKPSQLNATQLEWMLQNEMKSEEEMEATDPIVVFLQHGILNSANGWFVNELSSLPFFLADQGIQVWIGSNRGTRFSSGFEQYRTSWHEMGTLDLPAQIHYALSISRASRLNFLCHSQGCSQGFVGLSQVPQLSKQIHHFIGLDPVMRVRSKFLSRIFKYYACIFGGSGVQYLFDLIAGESLIHHFETGRKLAFPWLAMFYRLIPQKWLRHILLCRHCTHKTFINMLKRNEPSATTKTNVLHWLQSMINFSFAPLGSEEEYELSNNVSSSVQFTIYYGDDFLARTEDMNTLKTWMQGANTDFKLVQKKSFDHNDFMMGPAVESLYEELIQDILTSKYATETCINPRVCSETDDAEQISKS